MPYRANEVSQARKDIPSLKNLSDSQVKKFIKIFNSLIKEGMAESKAIPIALSRVNKSAKETHTMTNSFVEGLASLINKHFGGNHNLQQIVKFNEEQMIAIEPLYCKPMEADLHEEGMTEEEIRKMVSNINANLDKISGNIGHALNTEGFHFIKAWVNECDCIIGDEIVPEGQPIIKVQFVDEKLWELRKSGKLQGLSIGALGHVIDNPDYKEEVDDSEAA
ncbi:putative serine protease domain-containing protein [Vibrio phage VPMCC14]|nr:putative serine protease domain-containing protein [Vibrio phage VPMCC14]